jgi:dGTPase
MERFGDHFDHNLHSLRIVEQFEQRYARFPGLNLTFEVREGIVKHSRDYGPGEVPGLAEYRLGERPPLEAQLIDLADEIAYNTADLDDAFEAEMFPVAQICDEVPHYQALWDQITTQFAGAPERLQFAEALRLLIDWLVSGLVAGAAAAVQASNVDSIEGVRKHPDRLAVFSPPAGATNSGLKKFLRSHVYFSKILVAERKRSAGAIADLFQYFLQNPGKLPENYRLAEGPIQRKICDYIAGMTDGFFRRVHDQLLGA